MKYYLDTEFDGLQGPTLSIALVPERGRSGYFIIDNVANDPWVQENVLPVMEEHDADLFRCIYLHQVRGFCETLFAGDADITIVADNMNDIVRFGQALGTTESGAYEPSPWNRMTFVVENVESYPTEIEGAVQHSAYWDAMALRHKLTGA